MKITTKREVFKCKCRGGVIGRWHMTETLSKVRRKNEKKKSKPITWESCREHWDCVSHRRKLKQRYETGYDYVEFLKMRVS